MNKFERSIDNTDEDITHESIKFFNINKNLSNILKLFII